MILKKNPADWPSFDAALFDMDGTLVDSEERTDEVVATLVARRGLDPGAIDDPTAFHGATWADIAGQLQSTFPSLDGPGLAGELQDAFHGSLVAAPPPPVPGAWEALRACLATVPTAIVTSSQRESLEVVLGHAGIAPGALLTICAEDVRRSKPAPEGYLAAAAALGVPAARCLVFEDSMAGLRAARAAGMTAIAIARTRRGDARRQLGTIAAQVVSDFRELPTDFFSPARPGGR